MTSQTLDDLEAVRTVTKALEGFGAPEQERIIRWAREKLGLPNTQAPTPPGVGGSGAPEVGGAAMTQGGQGKDIKTFVQAKNPQSDNQFAATVAYYYRFEAPATERKDSISANDLQEATRKVGRDRIPRPAQTLINAHQQGLIDKAGERGLYSINTVGENLVAMALPSQAGGTVPVKKRSRGKEKGKRSRGAVKKALPRTTSRKKSSRSKPSARK